MFVVSEQIKTQDLISHCLEANYFLLFVQVLLKNLLYMFYQQKD